MAVTFFFPPSPGRISDDPTTWDAVIAFYESHEDRIQNAVSYRDRNRPREEEQIGENQRLEEGRLQTEREAVKASEERRQFDRMGATERFLWMLEEARKAGQLQGAVLAEFEELKKNLPRIVGWVVGTAAVGFAAGAFGGPAGAAAFSAAMAALGLAGSAEAILRFVKLYFSVKSAESSDALRPLIPEFAEIIAELIANGALTIILSGAAKAGGNRGTNYEIDTDRNTARSGPNFRRRTDDPAESPDTKGQRSTSADQVPDEPTAPAQSTTESSGSPAAPSKPSPPTGEAWRRAYERGEIAVDPNSIRYTQRKAGGGDPPRAIGLQENLSKGWDPDFPDAAIDVIETPDGLLSLDNTRVAIAQEKGIPFITARVRQTNELLPADFSAKRLKSFERVAKDLNMDPPRTWGDLFNIRIRDSKLPPTGTSTRPRLPE